jgi:hypothetical protein
VGTENESLMSERDIYLSKRLLSNDAKALRRATTKKITTYWSRFATFARAVVPKPPTANLEQVDHSSIDHGEIIDGVTTDSIADAPNAAVVLSQLSESSGDGEVDLNRTDDNDSLDDLSKDGVNVDDNTAKSSISKRHIITSDWLLENSNSDEIYGKYFQYLYMIPKVLKLPFTKVGYGSIRIMQSFYDKKLSHIYQFKTIARQRLMSRYSSGYGRRIDGTMQIYLIENITNGKRLERCFHKLVMQ